MKPTDESSSSGSAEAEPTAMCSRCGGTYRIATMNVMGLKNYQVPLEPCSCPPDAPSGVDTPPASE